MGALVGLGVGVGLLLVWSAFALPRPPRPLSGPGRIEELLVGAGIGNVTARSFLVLCGMLAVAAGSAVQLVSRTTPVALAFAAMAAYLPYAVVAGRARRRQREFAEVWPEAVDNLASAVRAGLSLPEALVGLGVRGPEALREAFVQFGLDYQVSGRFGESLDARWAEATWAGCCGTCRATCVTMPAPGPSSRRGRPGRSMAPGWRSQRPGWCC